MTTTIVDSHCHLNFPDFAEDLPGVLSRAENAGISVMQTICTTMSEFDEVHAIAAGHDHIYCSVGVHPHEAGQEPMVEVADLIEKAHLPEVIGIGETGLDYYYEHSDRASQQRSFRRHIEAARHSDLPVIIHTRDADEDTVAILQEEMGRGPFRVLIHCFSSTRWLADAVLEMGGYISISGIITFKKAEALREAIRHVPLERLLVETDAPYLAPVPYRGKRNEPAYTAHTCEALAALKEVSFEQCASQTTENFFRLFTKAAPASRD